MRCHFHLVNCHDAILDQTGIEVVDLDAAEAEALQAIQEMRQEDSLAEEDWRGWQLNVTSPDGEILLSIPLSIALQ